MTPASAAPYRIGIDVGGTFNDFVLADGRSGRLLHLKEPSEPSDPSAAVERGLGRLLATAGVAPAEIGGIVHGTTIALNAILQRRGARVGLVVSRGFGDTMELGRGGLPNSYNYKHPKQQALIPRDMVFEIGARVRPDGTVVASPEPAELDAVADRIAAAGLAAVAVLVVNSYAHPAVEAQVAAALRARLPEVLVTGSAELWPEIREFERALVTSLNAYVHPLMNAYYERLAARVRGLGIAGPVHVTTSNGGTVSLESARARPIDTLLSGPAAGVVAAAAVAAAAGRQRIVTIDMGGTSSDMAICQDGQPEFTTETKLGDFPLMLPVVNVWAIGAGGGSIVWVDAQGVLKVGPTSAGADPGPACYGRGGTQATVTDCYVATGMMDPATFLGGRMPLDRAAALAALERVADAVGLTGADRAVRAADAALRVATARMATEISKGMAQRGLDPASFTLIPFGGAGPTHAVRLADEARLNELLVPATPGVFCALGAVLADVKRDFARSRRLTLGADAGAGRVLADELAALEHAAREWIAHEGQFARPPSFEAICDMQYPRTAFDMKIAVPEAVWRSGDDAALAELFHVAHEHLYGFANRDSPVDVTTIRLRVTGVVARFDLPAWQGGPAVPPTRRQVHLDGVWLDAAVHRRVDLAVGAELTGPAIVEQDDTTVWIAPGWRASVDSIGSLLLNRII